MKILIHTMYFLPEFGSAPILMSELAAYLAQKGREVEVVTTIPRPPHNADYIGKFFVRENREGYRVKRFLTNSTIHHIGRLVAWSIYTALTIFNLIKVRRGDLLFLRLPPLPLGVTGVLGRRLRGARVVLNVQDIHPDLSIESGLLRNPFAIKLAKAFEKWIYRHTEDIVVISEGFKKNLEAKNILPSKIKVIPNWVDTDFLKPLPKDNLVSQRFSLRQKFVVMYSGTISISSYLTLERILEAADLLKNDPEIVFAIGGEGLKKNDLRERARKLGLSNVIFLPFQPYEDLPALLASSDVLLVPLDKEKSQLSVPSKLYHFMAAGRPILGLAHSDSEVYKIIYETRCGLCAPPEDARKIAEAVLALKKSRENREAMALNGRQFALDHFSKAQVLKAFDNLLSCLSRE